MRVVAWRDDDGDGAIDGADSDCDPTFSLDNVVSVSPTTAFCPNPSDGVITISATGTDVSYSIDGGATFSLSNKFEGLFPGDYEIVIKNLLTE